MQDSSLRNDFNEYREILQSHTENYSDDDFANISAMESLDVSQSHIKMQHTINEDVVAEDRVTPVPQLFPPSALEQESSHQKLSKHRVSKIGMATTGKKANP